MNKQRRSELSKIWDRLNEAKAVQGNIIDATLMKLTDEVAAAKEIFEGFKDDIQEVLDGEQEAYDNLPEGLQNGDKGQLIQDAINYMEEAQSKLDEIIDKLDIDMSLLDFESEGQDSLEAIDNAKGTE